MSIGINKRQQRDFLPLTELYKENHRLGGYDLSRNIKSPAGFIACRAMLLKFCHDSAVSTFSKSQKVAKIKAF